MHHLIFVFHHFPKSLVVRTSTESLPRKPGLANIMSLDLLPVQKNKFIDIPRSIVQMIVKLLRNLPPNVLRSFQQFKNFFRLFPIQFKIFIVLISFKKAIRYKLEIAVAPQFQQKSAVVALHAKIRADMVRKNNHIFIQILKLHSIPLLPKSVCPTSEIISYFPRSFHDF